MGFVGLSETSVSPLHGVSESQVSNPVNPSTPTRRSSVHLLPYALTIFLERNPPLDFFPQRNPGFLLFFCESNTKPFADFVSEYRAE